LMARIDGRGVVQIISVCGRRRMSGLLLMAVPKERSLRWKYRIAKLNGIGKG